MTLPPSSGGAKASQQGQDSLFQIPGATPGVQDHSALSSESQGAQKLEAGLDQMLERFVEDLQKKTGLGPEVLMAGLSQSLQHLPNLDEMVQTFTEHIGADSSSEGAHQAVPAAQLQENLRAFLKGVQQVLAQETPGRAVPSEKSYQFEVLNEAQAKDRRSQEIVRRIQEEFFSHQAPMAETEQVTLPHGPQKAARNFHSTADFFKAREQDHQLMARLQQLGPSHRAPEAVPEVATASVRSSDQGKSTLDPALEFSDGWLEHVAVHAPQPGPASPGGASAMKAGFAGALSAQIPEDATVENLNEIIQGARIAANSGGGDMEMELRPEGLGKVQVKVSVEGDQVQVQMVAENKKAQAMLQEGLQDLRAQLAAQKLHSENLTVSSTSDSAEPDLSGQKGSDGQQERPFAQGFMQQFREQRDSARSGMTRFPPVGGPRGRSTEVVQPLNVRPAHEGRLSLIA